MPEQGTSATDIAAWVGAVGSLFGVLAFAWDVYKWRKRGTELHVELLSNMLMQRPGSPPGDPSATVLIVVVNNRGAIPTTITNLVGEHYTSFWQRLPRRKPETALWIRPTLGGGQIPHELGPGQVWRGIVPQQGFDDMRKVGRIRIGLCHSGAEKPIYRWLRVRADTPKAG